MDDHKSKPNKKKTKKHHHHESNGTNAKNANIHNIHNEKKKIHLRPPHFDGVRTNDGHNTNGRVRETGRNELDVIVKARAFSFNPATNSYIMKLENVRLLSQNTTSHPQWIIFEIPPNKIHKTSQTQLLNEDDIDAILDEIDRNEHSKHDALLYGDDHDLNGAHHEYSRSLSYSRGRYQIKEDHLKEESKQQIPTIHEHNHHNHKQRHHSNGKRHQKQLDSLKSIPPIPSVQSHNKGSASSPNKRSYNKYRRGDERGAPDRDHVYMISANNKEKQQLMAEWKRIEIEYIENRNRGRECVDGARSIGNCICIERIKFMLFYYAKWVKIRTRNSSNNNNNSSDSDNDNDNGNNTNDLMYYYDAMSLFFEDLGYSAKELNDDFDHIRSHHINNNSSLLFDSGQEEEHEHDQEQELDSVSQRKGDRTSRRKPIQKRMRDKHETMEYFGLVLGKCDAKKCNILLRHCRDRDKIDNCEESKRKKLFFISSTLYAHDAQWMELEIYLESKLDIIHCALLHQQTNVMLLNKSKFITEITDINNEKANTNANAIKLNSVGSHNKSKISPFGESITYWDPSHHLFCGSKYSNFKEELLSNSLYRLSMSLFSSIHTFCCSFLLCSAGVSLRVFREHDWMKTYKMNAGSSISIQHVMAMYCYTNLSVLRRVFVRGAYRHYFNHDVVSRDELMVAHSEICNWSRLLLECVHCFGSPFNFAWRYYHGINCKLLFDRFNIMIDIPSSLTLDKDFAYTFSSGTGGDTGMEGGGIMVELNHGTLSDLQSLCFDNSAISEFPLEEERFIFHSYVSVKDIVINGLHHDQWLKIFGFWYKLKEGFFFDHLISSNNGDGITKNDQLCICAMIINMMLGQQNAENNKYDQRIPYYMQCLFNECIQNKAFVWIIDSEYTHLAPKLKSLLYYNTANLSKSSQFIRFLVSTKKCNVQKCQTFKWRIADQDNELHSLLYGHNEWIKSEQYKIYLYFNKNYNITHCLSFHFQVQDKPKNGLFRCRIHLDSFPQNINKINLGVGIYVDKINIDNYSYAEIQTKHKLYNSSLHSLFKTKLLAKYKELNLKLQIQLFYLYDTNGKIIKFQPV